MLIVFLGTTPSVTIIVQFERRLGYYIIQIYTPSVFLVTLSWLSFFMDSEDIANRLTLEVTMILAIVFLLTSSNSSMPRFSYAKASDVFMITSFCFIFMVLLQSMFCYQLSRKRRRKRYVEKNSV